ncbi:MAG TPA: hypothetical protein GX708_07385 [Gallicola sp.]|nr:hypothetical protein [Gallicola sp.]
MEILIGLLIITLFGAITYINLKEQENLKKENELLKGQQLQYRRVLYENDLIPKEFVGDNND